MCIKEIRNPAAKVFKYLKILNLYSKTIIRFRFQIISKNRTTEYSVSGLDRFHFKPHIKLFKRSRILNSKFFIICIKVHKRIEQC